VRRRDKKAVFTDLSTAIQAVDGLDLTGRLWSGNAAAGGNPRPVRRQGAPPSTPPTS
jgi:hypothetical protein